MKTPNMNRFGFAMSTLLLLMTSLFSGCASKEIRVGNGESQEVIPFVGPTQVNRFILKNGLRLLVVEDHSSPTFAYQTWFKVGSRDEVPSYTGLAHLFEHMMFKGTKNLKDGEFDRLLESAGAEGENAFTNRDYTAYVQEMPRDKLELIAKLESDRMVNLVVDDHAFKTEREVVQNERRYRNENNPDGLMYQELFQVAYSKHSYRWPVIGYTEDLERMSSEDARKFYKSYYAPNHATVVVVGDVKPSEVYSTIEKYYGQIPNAEAPAHEIQSEPQQTSPRRKNLTLNIQVEKLLMGFHVPSATHDDLPALEVLQAVLGGGKSSRLYRALVDTGIASSVDAYVMEEKDPSLFVIGCNLQKGKKATQAESVVLKELSRIAKEGISPPELERAKNRVNFGFYGGLESDSEKAHFLGNYEATTGNFEIGLALFKKIANVNPLDIQAVVKRHLDPRNRTIITGVHK